MSWCRRLVVCSMFAAPLAQAQPSGAMDPPAPEARDRLEGRDASSRPELHVNAGVGYARRAFDYDMTGRGPRSMPPSIHSTAPELQIDGDIYPFALADRAGPLANLGFALTYDQAMGSTVQTTGADRDIDQSYFAVGPRYRFMLDQRSSIAVGLDYVHQQYIVEHAAYQPQLAGVPDIAYSAIAPAVNGRFAVAPGTMLVTNLGAWFVIDAGQITNLDQFGKARVIGLTAVAGAEFAVTARINLSVLFHYTRVGLTFDGVGAMSNNLDADPATQDVAGATDETAGVVATLGLHY